MAQISQTFRKDPDAVLDYGFDWSDWLAAGETISTSVWTVPAGITKDSATFDDTTTLIWLSGGTAGDEYDLSCKITTSASRTDERSLQVIVENR